MKEDNKIFNMQSEKISSYHFSVPEGWINDPNGIIFYNDSYKIFYQYNPFENHRNNISIGVATSFDLLKFDNYKVALAPTKEVDGIFSGSVSSDDEGLHLIFTKHIERQNYRKESVSAGISLDGDDFYTNFEDIIVEKSLPEYDPENFRDPYIYFEDGYYYMLVASKDKELDLGKVIVLRSESLSNFEYFFEIGPLQVFGNMVECPAIGKIGNDYVLVYSYIKKIRDDKEEHKTAYLILRIDLEVGTFAVLKHGQLDNSIDFYAPTLFKTANDDLALISWFNSWDYTPIEQVNGLKSCGIFSYPRILDVEHGDLIQKPYRGILGKVTKQFKYDGSYIKTNSLLKIVAKGECKINFIDEKSNIVIEMLYFKNKLSLKANEHIDTSIFEYKDNITLLVLIDYSSVEVFINHGKETLSRRVYFNSETIKLDVQRKDNVNSLVVALVDLDE